MSKKLELLDRIGSIVDQLENFMEDLNTVTIGDESTLDEIDTRTSSSEEDDEEESASRETEDVTGGGDDVGDGLRGYYDDEATDEVEQVQEQAQDENTQVNDTNKETEPEIIELV